MALRILDRFALAEEGAAAERAIEARPALTLAKLLLQAIEAAQAPTEIVGHVYEGRLARAGQDWAPVLERPVVGEHDVRERLRKCRREVLELLDLAPHEVVAKGDLALQAPGVGQVDARGVGRVGL